MAGVIVRWVKSRAKRADHHCVDGVCPSGDLSTRGRLVVLGLLLVTLAGRAAFVVLPVNLDTAMFVYAGKLVDAGGRPGVDLLDNKLPTVGLLMSVPYRGFGACWPAYGGLGLLLALGAIVFLYRVARDLWGDRAAVVVAVAATLWLNFPPLVYSQLQLETVQVFFVSVAAAGVLRLLRNRDWRDAFTVGLCVGLAMWAKPTAGAVIGAAVVVIAARRSWRWGDRARLIGWITLGLGVPLVTGLGLIAVTGMADGLPDTLKQLHDYAAGSSADWLDAAKPVVVVAVLGFPILVLGGVFRRDREANEARPVEVAFVLLWLAAELTAVVMQRRMYAYHFLVLAPPAALATGLIARRLRGRSLLMAFGPAAAVSGMWTTLVLVGQKAETREDRIVAYVETHTAPGDAVWMDEYPRLLTETGRRAGSRVPLILLFANGDDAPDFFGSRLLADWQAARPRYIALASDPARVVDLYRHHMADVAGSAPRAAAIERQIEAMQQYVTAHYRAEAEIDGVTLWRRDDGTPPGHSPSSAFATVAGP